MMKLSKHATVKCTAAICGWLRYAAGVACCVNDLQVQPSCSVTHFCILYVSRLPRLGTRKRTSWCSLKNMRFTEPGTSRSRVKHECRAPLCMRKEGNAFTCNQSQHKETDITLMKMYRKILTSLKLVFTLRSSRTIMQTMWFSLYLAGCVRFAQYCCKIYSRHLDTALQCDNNDCWCHASLRKTENAIKLFFITLKELYQVPRC